MPLFTLSNYHLHVRVLMRNIIYVTQQKVVSNTAENCVWGGVCVDGGVCVCRADLKLLYKIAMCVVYLKKLN